MAIPPRSFCSSPYHKGPRWLLSVYFYRRRDGLQNRCITCTKIAGRRANLSENTKRAQSEYSRQYKEKRRRAEGVPSRNLTNPKFRSKDLKKWLERYLTTVWVDEYTFVKHLNGLRMEKRDASWIDRLGTYERVGFKRVDEIATRYDLPLWEMVEAAGCYRRDKRTYPHRQ